MSKRTFFITLMIVPIGVAAIVVVWRCFSTSVPTTDADKYERWKQTSENAGRVYWWEWRLPKGVVKLFHLSKADQAYWDEHQKLGDSLLASGFLTNATFTVAVAPTNTTQRLQMMACLDKAFPGKDEWEFWVNRRGNVVIECQPQNAFLAGQAVQEWEKSNPGP